MQVNESVVVEGGGGRTDDDNNNDNIIILTQSGDIVADRCRVQGRRQSGPASVKVAQAPGSGGPQFPTASHSCLCARVNRSRPPRHVAIAPPAATERGNPISRGPSGSSARNIIILYYLHECQSRFIFTWSIRIVQYTFHSVRLRVGSTYIIRNVYWLYKRANAYAAQRDRGGGYRYSEKQSTADVQDAVFVFIHIS